MSTTAEPSREPSYIPDLTGRANAIVGVLSQAALGRILTVHASTVSRWVKGEDQPSGPRAAAVVDIDYVLSRYALEYPAATFEGWLTSPNPFLDGATPKDVLLLEGPGRVVNALSSETAGSYA